MANGLAIGGGVVLLSLCDLRLAAESAWFSIPEVELDLPLTWQALPRLMRELGPARTKELVMACERFTSEQAERVGLRQPRPSRRRAAGRHPGARGPTPLDGPAGARLDQGGVPRRSPTP